ncbi:hypothetical protein [Pseudalkalibacillus hwajinpoensis]|uniref:hypothetical protein n=1 Tax=Guptibacillus hwajinpoensis TaxID=208199 RepID=UPI001CD6FFD4|nr:hypothetical protein [Pseudalkalibacillus hwajinpoensis]MCA0993830.1 hypothetical protein [Pseudalkalibacillus hwajinpoensis]
MNVYQNQDDLVFSYLRLKSHRFIRWSTVAITLVFLDLFGFIPLLTNDGSLVVMLTLFSIVGILNFWAFQLFLDPYEYESGYYLYLGVLGVITTILFVFVHLQVVSQYVSGNERIYLLIGNGLLLLLLTGCFHLLNRNLLYGKAYDQTKNTRANRKLKIVIGGLATLYILGHVGILIMGEAPIRHFIVLTLLSLFTVVTSYLTTFFHRYRFLRKHVSVLEKRDACFGLPKHLRIPEYEGDAFTVIIFNDVDMDEERFIELAGSFTEEGAEEVQLIEIDEDGRRKLEERFPQQEIQQEGFAVIKVNRERVLQNLRELKKRTMLKILYRNIPHQVYEETKHEALFHLDDAVFYSTREEEVMAFLANERGQVRT